MRGLISFFATNKRFLVGFLLGPYAWTKPPRPRLALVLWTVPFAWLLVIVLVRITIALVAMSNPGDG